MFYGISFDWDIMYDIYRVAQKKRPEHLHALFSRVDEMN